MKNNTDQNRGVFFGTGVAGAQLELEISQNGYGAGACMMHEAVCKLILSH